MRFILTALRPKVVAFVSKFLIFLNETDDPCINENISFVNLIKQINRHVKIVIDLVPVEFLVRLCSDEFKYISVVRRFFILQVDIIR